MDTATQTGARTAAIAEVMVREVVTAALDTPVKDVVELLVTHSISAVPVVNRGGAVLGVVSEADLLCRREHEDQDGSTAPWYAGARTRDHYHRAAGLTAAEVMTAPARTIGPDATLPDAARVLAGAGVRRLFVVADGRLVGVVARRDLLRGLLRDDSDIRAEIDRDIFDHVLHANPAAVRTTVEHGVVTLTGRVQYEADKRTAARLVHTVTGVLDVRNRLDYLWNGDGGDTDEPG
jgi:CBS domain-containing protein